MLILSQRFTWFSDVRRIQMICESPNVVIVCVISCLKFFAYACHEHLPRRKGN